jgi:hypothetical protein
MTVLCTTDVVLVLMFDIHRTTEAPVKPAPNPVQPRDERIAAAGIAGYILELAKGS